MSELLTLDDIAARVGESRNYVRDELVKRGDFPTPALALSQKKRKWSVADFETGLKKHQQRLAR